MTRVASLLDAEQILRVVNTSNWGAHREIIPREHFREPVLSMEKLLADLERKTFYVREHRGEVVGVSALEVEDERTGSMDWVYVLPEHQRKGIGTALVRQLKSKAMAMGLKRLRLLAVEKAHWAIEF